MKLCLLIKLMIQNKSKKTQVAFKPNSYDLTTAIKKPGVKSTLPSPPSVPRFAACTWIADQSDGKTIKQSHLKLVFDSSWILAENLSSCSIHQWIVISYKFSIKIQTRKPNSLQQYLSSIFSQFYNKYKHKMYVRNTPLKRHCNLNIFNNTLICFFYLTTVTQR